MQAFFCIWTQNAQKLQKECTIAFTRLQRGQSQRFMKKVNDCALLSKTFCSFIAKKSERLGLWKTEKALLLWFYFCCKMCFFLMNRPTQNWRKAPSSISIILTQGECLKEKGEKAETDHLHFCTYFHWEGLSCVSSTARPRDGIYCYLSKWEDCNFAPSSSEKREMDAKITCRSRNEELSRYIAW